MRLKQRIERAETQVSEIVSQDLRLAQLRTFAESERAFEIIKSRLDGKPYKEIAAELGASAPRIRQIAESSLRRMRGVGRLVPGRPAPGWIVPSERNIHFTQDGVVSDGIAITILS